MYVVYGLVMLCLALVPKPHLSTPLKVWCISWAIAWLAHAALAGVYYSSDEALFFVFLANILFAFGGWAFYFFPRLVRSHAAHRESAVLRYLAGESSRITFCYVFLALSLISIVYGASQLGGLAALKSGLFEAMKSNKAALIEGEEYAIPLGIKLANMMVLTTSILAGLAFASKGKTQSTLGFAFLVPFVTSVLLLSAVTGVRGYILSSGLFFGFSYISGRTFINFGRNVVRPKVIVYGLVAVTAFLVWTVIVQSARLEDTRLQNLSGTLEHLRPWFGGYLPALSVWYDNHYSGDYRLGAYLLRGILAPLGLVSGEGFNERMDFSWIGNGQASNAMTAFRAMWADFGPFGTAAFCLVWGFFSSYSFQAAMNKGRAWLVLLACNYCAIFFSINYWFFAHGAKIFAAIISAAIILASYYPLKIKRHV